MTSRENGGGATGARMDSLISKLEAATEGSDALDREIAAACKIEWSPDEDGNFGGYNILPKRCWFSRSLDAALTLVPDDPANPGKPMLWSIAYDEDGVGGARGYCAGLGKGYHDPQIIYGHSAATPALALCIAALKARKAGGET